MAINPAQSQYMTGGPVEKFAMGPSSGAIFLSSMANAYNQSQQQKQAQQQQAQQSMLTSVLPTLINSGQASYNGQPFNPQQPLQNFSYGVSPALQQKNTEAALQQQKLQQEILKLKKNNNKTPQDELYEKMLTNVGPYVAMGGVEDMDALINKLRDLSEKGFAYKESLGLYDKEASSGSVGTAKGDDKVREQAIAALKAEGHAVTEKNIEWAKGQLGGK